MPDLQKAIKGAIKKAVQQKVVNRIEDFVKNEVLKELRKQGVTDRQDPKEWANKTIPLVAQENLRKTIGSLGMKRIKGVVAEQLRFQLNGVKARNKQDAIDMNKLQAQVETAVTDAIKKGLLRRI